MTNIKKLKSEAEQVVNRVYAEEQDFMNYMLNQGSDVVYREAHKIYFFNEVLFQLDCLLESDDEEMLSYVAELSGVKGNILNLFYDDYLDGDFFPFNEWLVDNIRRKYTRRKFNEQF